MSSTGRLSPLLSQIFEEDLLLKSLDLDQPKIPSHLRLPRSLDTASSLYLYLRIPAGVEADANTRIFHFQTSPTSLFSNENQVEALEAVKDFGLLRFSGLA